MCHLKGKVFHIDPIVRGYNLAMVAVNLYIAYELLVNTIGHYNWICEPVDATESPRSMRIASAIYLFWFSKLIELLDSVFFILRGKYNQGKRFHQLCCESVFSKSPHQICMPSLKKVSNLVNLDNGFDLCIKFPMNLCLYSSEI